MSKKKILIVAGLILTAGAAAVYAAKGDRSERMMRHGMMGDHMGMGGEQGMGPGRRDMGHRMFGGGKLSAEQFDTKTRERFAAFDKNSDGIIDAPEIEAAFAAERQGRGFRGRGHGQGGAVGHDGSGMMRMFDENKDGKISKDEARAAAERRFALADLNNDGKIDDADLPPMMRGKGALSADTGMMGRRGGMNGEMGGGFGQFRAADANKDGTVTKEEYLAHAAKRHAEMDRNGDGLVDQADFAAMQKETTDYRVKRFIHMFGADKDGKITREQFTKVAKERFARMDGNGDGTITREEMGGRRGMRGPGHGGRQGMEQPGLETAPAPEKK